MWARAVSGAFVLFLSIVSACASRPAPLDLAENEQIYRAPRYVTRVPVDRAAFLLPIADERDARPADASAPAFPRRPMPEELWARPIPEMLDDVLHDGLLRAGLVAAIDTRVPPAPEVILVEPFLLDARGFLEEQIAGRCTLATLAIRVVVSSPADASGKRELWFDETYEQSAGTQPTRSPTPIPELMGRALYDAMKRFMSDFDRSNVARSGLPIRRK